MGAVSLRSNGHVSHEERVANLVTRHIGLAKNAARRANRRFPTSFEDLFSWACEGLWQAAERYDPDSGVKFSTYANSRITGAIIDGYRSLNRTRRKHNRAEGQPAATQISLLNDSGAISIFQEVVEGSTLEAIVPDHTVRFEEAFTLHEAMEGAMRCLHPREEYVIRLYYYLGYRLREIGRMLGVTESRVSQLHTRAIGKLRIYFGVNEKPTTEEKYQLLIGIVIRYLQEHGGRIVAGTQTIAFKIGGLLGVHHTTAGHILKRMEKGGLVHCVKKHRRVQEVHLLAA